MKRFPRALPLCVAVLAAVARAGAAAPVPAPAQLVQIEAALESEGSPGKAQLHVAVRIAEGWHVNSHTPSEDYLIPTNVALEAVPSVTAGPARYPDGKLLKFAFSDKPLSVYENHFSVDIPITWSGAPPGSFRQARVSGLQRQTMPRSGLRRFHWSRTLAAVREARSPSLGAPCAFPDAPASNAGAGTAKASGASQDFGALLEKRGILVVLSLLFLGGLALNLTPCVYPVIPLTVSFFGGQAQGERSRSFGLATLYVLGMATMYSGLGVAAALSGKLFGAALQSPWVLGGVAAVLIALARCSGCRPHDALLCQKTGPARERRGLRHGHARWDRRGFAWPLRSRPARFRCRSAVRAAGFLFFFVLAGLGALPLPGRLLGRIAALPRAGF
jgi:thiol:disulfide interchange protein DsbD